MDKDDLKNQVLPEQEKGVPIDTEKSIELPNEDEAIRFYQIARQRLVDVNRWHEIAGKLTAEFSLRDATGKPVARTAQKGDHFKIDIPGPGSKGGGGFDWIQIEDFVEKQEPGFESIAFTVRPATNPEKHTEHVSHFFSPESTSTFSVSRKNNVVTAGIYDRNTKPNTSGDTIPDKIRNTIIGAFGVGGGAKLQWESLASALIEKEEKQTEH